MIRSKWYSEALEVLAERPLKLTLIGAAALVTIAGIGIVTGWMFQNPPPGWYEVAFMASAYGTGLGAMYCKGLAAADKALGRVIMAKLWDGIDILPPDITRGPVCHPPKWLKKYQGVVSRARQQSDS